MKNKFSNKIIVILQDKLLYYSYGKQESNFPSPSTELTTPKWKAQSLPLSHESTWEGGKIEDI